MGDVKDSDDLNNCSTISGESRDLRDRISGLEDFAAHWEHDVELPHQMSFGGWQMADEGHPAGSGLPAYRLVHKMIRTIPLPSIEVDLGRLMMRISNKGVTIGEPIFENALPARREGEFLVPEWGEIVDDGAGGSKYSYTPSNEIKVRARQEQLESANIVEILCQVPEGTGGSHSEQLAAGRAEVAPLTAALDLIFGQRFLGPVLTEEVGSVFEDWHWNRKLGGRSVGIEAQARLERLHPSDFVEKFEPFISRLSDLQDEEFQRARIASQWYWRAEGEADNVLSYIGYWLVVEALELDENSSNINPVKDSVASVLDVARSDISDRTGRLYGIRNKLLHGKRRRVDGESVRRVSILATALLESHLMGTVSPERLELLRTALVSPSTQLAEADD